MPVPVPDSQGFEYWSVQSLAKVSPFDGGQCLEYKVSVSTLREIFAIIIYE